jgi:4-hydroxybenzoate polyprenyltransferase
MYTPGAAESVPEMSGGEERVDKKNLAAAEIQAPLCVDLDGTLIRTDLLWESLIILLARNPFYAVLLPVWLLKGRAWLKLQIASRVLLDPRGLPYHPEFLEYLRDQRRLGRHLVLVTASHTALAESVAQHLGLFHEVVGSDATRNLKGSLKRDWLIERFGKGGFDYAGNSSADVFVWQGCGRSIVVSASEGVGRRAAGVSTVERTFPRGGAGGFKTFRRAVRDHQWVKNLLVFVPLVTSHKVLHFSLLLDTVLAFVAFCFCASSVYLLNDLLDLRADRLHPTKRRRPLASGDLSIPAGLAILVTMLAAAGLTALLLPFAFRVVLGVYYALTLAYSMSLKRRLLVDIFVLGGLYTIRVLAGSAATGIEASPWLLAFCLFFFLSLALLKRYTELRTVKDEEGGALSARGYIPADLPLISSLGTSSGFLCVLVLALYVNSPQVAPLYQSPAVLWFLCPLSLYWISRMWLMANRGTMNEDPVLFAVRDRISYLTVGCGGVILALATRHWRL